MSETRALEILKTIVQQSKIRDIPLEKAQEFLEKNKYIDLGDLDKGSIEYYAGLGNTYEYGVENRYPEGMSEDVAMMHGLPKQKETKTWTGVAIGISWNYNNVRRMWDNESLAHWQFDSLKSAWEWLARL